MQKFIQISLVIVLMFVLFQTAAGGFVNSSDSIGSGIDTSTSTALDTSAEGMQMAADCLVRVKGVICVRPNVGWNS